MIAPQLSWHIFTAMTQTIAYKQGNTITTTRFRLGALTSKYSLVLRASRVTCNHAPNMTYDTDLLNTFSMILCATTKKSGKQFIWCWQFHTSPEPRCISILLKYISQGTMNILSCTRCLYKEIHVTVFGLLSSAQSLKYAYTVWCFVTIVFEENSCFTELYICVCRTCAWHVMGDINGEYVIKV